MQDHHAKELLLVHTESLDFMIRLIPVIFDLDELLQRCEMLIVIVAFARVENLDGVVTLGKVLEQVFLVLSYDAIPILFLQLVRKLAGLFVVIELQFIFHMTEHDLYLDPLSVFQIILSFIIVFLTDSSNLL